MITTVSKWISWVVWVFGFFAPIMSVFTVYCPLLTNTGPEITGMLEDVEAKAFGTIGSTSP